MSHKTGDKIHPLQAWLDEKNLSYEDAAKICKKKGLKTSYKYLEQIACGYYEPSYRFCKFLSEKLTGKSISTIELKEFPYTIRGSSAGK